MKPLLNEALCGLQISPSMEENQPLPSTTSPSHSDVTFGDVPQGGVVAWNNNSDNSNALQHWSLQRGNRNNQWSEEEGKMILGHHLFCTVLPTSLDVAGLRKRISELRVALQASESARLENEQETEALRKYLAEVEAAAADLQVRVQEKEQLISLSSKHETRELDNLRAKLAMEASEEVRIQTATAAQAVVAARESTMELDKVKRHASALLKAQDKEIERLRIEAAKCQTLNHAKSVKIEELKNRIANLEEEIKQQCEIVEHAQKFSQGDAKNLLKQAEEAKMEAHATASQYAKLLEAFEITKNAAESIEKNLEEHKKEKKDLKSHNDWLENQVAELQSHEASASTVSHYDHELCQVRAVLGSEKQHLLAELAMLRQGNQTLKGELVEWQEKCRALSQCLASSAPEPSLNNKLRSHFSKNYLKPASFSSLNSENMGKCKPSPRHKAHSRKGFGNSECLKGCNCARSQCIGKENSQIFSKKKPASSNGECSSEISNMTYDGNDGILREVGNPSVSSLEGGNDVDFSGEVSKSQEKSLILRDNLLAAAHKEVVKLREINQCLVLACQNKFKLSKHWRDLIREGGCVELDIC